MRDDKKLELEIQEATFTTGLSISLSVLLEGMIKDNKSKVLNSDDIRISFAKSLRNVADKIDPQIELVKIDE